MDRRLYPKRWKDITYQLKAQAGWQCQMCKKAHGEWTYNRHGHRCKVILSVAHLDHDVRNPDARLAVLCLQCHLSYDLSRAQRGRKAAQMEMARGQLPLLLCESKEGCMPP
jgi:hypothetical protein